MWLFCGCGPHLATAPTLPGDDAFSAPTDVQPTGLDNDRPPADVLAPGDIVTLHIVSQTTSVIPGLMVGADGTIPVTLAGHVEVAGLSLADATVKIRTLLQQFDRFANPSLILVRADGRRVAVLGSVAKPGVHPVTPGLRVADVLALSGGPKTTVFNGDVFVDADLEAARIVREGKNVPISLSRALQGDPKHNIHVFPGDFLWIPSLSSKRVSVLGDVQRAGSLRYRAGMRLTEALASAGGTTWEADEADVRIIRGPLSKPRVYTASLEDIVDGRRADIELAPGDVVFVTEHWFATVSEVIRRLTPVLIAAGVAATLTQ